MKREKKKKKKKKRKPIQPNLQGPVNLLADSQEPNKLCNGPFCDEPWVSAVSTVSTARAIIISMSKFIAPVTIKVFRRTTL